MANSDKDAHSRALADYIFLRLSGIEKASIPPAMTFLNNLLFDVGMNRVTERSHFYYNINPYDTDMTYVVDKGALAIFKAYVVSTLRNLSLHQRFIIDRVMNRIFDNYEEKDLYIGDIDPYEETEHETYQHKIKPLLDFKSI